MRLTPDFVAVCWLSCVLVHAAPPPTCDWASSALGSFSGSCLAFWAFVLPGSPGLGACSCLAFWAFALQGSSRLGAGSCWAFVGLCAPRSELELLAGSSPLVTKSQSQGSPSLRHRTHCPRSRLAPSFSLPPRLQDSVALRPCLWSSPLASARLRLLVVVLVGLESPGWLPVRSSAFAWL